MWLAIPAWSDLRLESVLFCLALLGCALSQWRVAIAEKRARDGSSASEFASGILYNRVRNRYLLVYLLAAFGDWIQGGYQYAIYREYGYSKAEIGYLFIMGYGISATVGTYVGAMGDHFGQRRNCMLYGVLYALSCLCVNGSSLVLLLLGRLLGGLAYSILYCSFEAWLIAHSRSCGLSSSDLCRLFATATFGNASMAVVAGVVGQVTVSVVEPLQLPNLYVAPFNLAILSLLAVSVVAKCHWAEHFGSVEGGSSAITSGKDAKDTQTCASTTKVLTTLRQSANTIVRSVILRNLALINGFYEGVLFVFVFIWTPSLEQRAPEGTTVPHGLVFSLFMLCKMVGSNLFKLLPHMLGSCSAEVCLELVFVVGMVCFLLPILLQSYQCTLLCFCLFEGTLGLYWPAIAVLRAQHIQDDSRSSMASLFRVILNVLTVLVLLVVGHIQESAVLLLCIGMLGCCWSCIQSVKGVVGIQGASIEFQQLSTVED